MTPDYQAWNNALARRFLLERPGDALYLYTDDSVLQEVAADVPVSLVDAPDRFVSSVVGTLHGKEPFREWIGVARSFGKEPSSEPPPYFALLCFLVFVAVERESTRFQYYPELNAHLNRKDSGAPPGFEEHVPRLFQLFNEWLTGPGALHGVPTAKPPTHFPNVGWPLSQAIVRPPDRGYLVRLFSALQFDARVPMSRDRLRSRVVPHLRAGASTPSQRRLLNLYETHPETFDDVLDREFKDWDGSSNLRMGPSSVQLRLCLDETSGEWWFLGPRMAGTEDLSWNVGSDAGGMSPFKGLEAVPDELWDLVGLGVIGRVKGGPKLLSPSRRIRWMSVDFAAGGWAETSRREVGTEQLAVVRSHDDVVNGLNGPADLGLRPQGHRVYRVPAWFDFEAVAESDDEALPPRLDGGLCLNRSTQTYLRSRLGPPRIVNASPVVTVDGQQYPTVDGVLDLGALSLSSGQHLVKCGNRELAFRLIGELQAGPSPRAETWLDDIGTSVRVSVPHSGGDVWFIGREGEVEKRSPYVLSWLGDVGLGTYEVDVTGFVRGLTFTPAFVVSPSYMGKPWVERVPTTLTRPNSGTSKLPEVGELRGLVAALLGGSRPDHVVSGRDWKKALAALLRTAHR